MKKVIFLLLPVLFLSLVSTANAELISIAIEGTVTSVLDEGPDDGWLDSKINIGDPVTGTYTYDTLTADTDPLSQVGEYDHYNSPCGIFVNIGGSNGLNFQTDSDNMLFRMVIRDSYPSSGDDYVVRSYTNLALSTGAEVDLIFLNFDDSTGAIIFSDDLPLTAPDLDQWQSAYLNINGEGCLGYDINIDITSVQLVPEPTTFLVLLLGIVCLRKKSSH